MNTDHGSVGDVRRYSRVFGNGNGTGQVTECDSKVFLKRCLGQVPSLSIHLDHESHSWYIWNSVEVKSLRLNSSDASVQDSLPPSPPAIVRLRGNILRRNALANISHRASTRRDDVGRSGSGQHAKIWGLLYDNFKASELSCATILVRCVDT